MDRLQGRTAVITGAASGIGHALAEHAASEGMQLVLADVDFAGLERVADQLDATVEVVRCDVSEPGDVEALADTAYDRFGAVHLLCNNAGVGGGGPMAELTLHDWQWVLGVNLWGVIHGITSFLPRMLAGGDDGHIVNTASMAGFFAPPNMGPYSVSKFGVVALSESLRAELAGTRLHVSALCPGWVRTRIHESERNRPESLTVDRPPRPAEQADMMREVIESGLPPAEVAQRVFDAVRAERFWIFTHPEMVRATAARHEDVLSHLPDDLD